MSSKLPPEKFYYFKAKILLWPSEKFQKEVEYNCSMEWHKNYPPSDRKIKKHLMNNAKIWGVAQRILSITRK